MEGQRKQHTISFFLHWRFCSVHFIARFLNNHFMFYTFYYFVNNKLRKRLWTEQKHQWIFFCLLYIAFSLLSQKQEIDPQDLTFKAVSGTSLIRNFILWVTMSRSFWRLLRFVFDPILHSLLIWTTRQISLGVSIPLINSLSILCQIISLSASSRNLKSRQSTTDCRRQTLFLEQTLLISANNFGSLPHRLNIR